MSEKGESGTALLLRALSFSAEKHRDQRRKGVAASPYINHPIAVAEVLARTGVSDHEILAAAVLHDTIEDTETTGEELETRFGSRIRRLVEEVTDDKALPRDTRKDLQIEHAPDLSDGAKQIKIADKICNVRDVTHAAPAKWPLRRRLEYLDWTEAVVEGCRGVNSRLEELYDRSLSEGRRLLGGDGTGETGRS